jgi:uncharacterized protein YndB with AHSA1/START domain
MIATVTQSVTIHAHTERVFEYLADPALLKGWWPKDCRSDRVQGGKLHFTWGNDQVLETLLSVYRPPASLEFPFYTQHCAFLLTPETTNTTLQVIHSNIEYTLEDVSTVCHVSECWGALLVSLKALIEYGIDLRI